MSNPPSRQCATPRPGSVRMLARPRAASCAAPFARVGWSQIHLLLRDRARFLTFVVCLSPYGPAAAQIGVHWLVGLYENGLNGILGDEMGLGKTVQSISMLAHLMEQGVHGPFMVVGPLSTLYNWKNEFKKWTPKVDAVIYHGSKDTRANIRGTHFRGKGKNADFPVLITSYEIIIRDRKELNKIDWKFVIIDEGHRLKNMNCRLIRDLKQICGEGCNRLLLTGTPLQNNLTELWSLLNFLLPSIFDDLDSFQAWFDFDFKAEDHEEKVMQGEMQHSVVTKLHQILRPFLLRRLKVDVEIGLPKKYEYILFAWMTEWQQSMYSDLLAKQLADSAGKQMRLQNVLMQYAARPKMSPLSPQLERHRPNPGFTRSCARPPCRAGSASAATTRTCLTGRWTRRAMRWSTKSSCRRPARWSCLIAFLPRSSKRRKASIRRARLPRLCMEP